MLQGPGLPAMPLSLVAGGDTVTVTRVRGGEDLKRRLADLGFVEGSEVHVVSTSGSNVIVTVKGARLALNRSMASRITVSI